MPRPAAVLFLAVVAIGVTLSPSAQDRTEPGFQTEANYVRVDVYPTAGGKPVRDLRQAEMEVLEDGAPQAIAQFEHVSIGGPRSGGR